MQAFPAAAECMYLRHATTTRLATTATALRDALQSVIHKQLCDSQKPAQLTQVSTALLAAKADV
jgi:hypothetical protein